MKTKTTIEQLNKIIEFRQAIHQNCLTKYRDAQFDLMDSVLSNQRVSSYAELTLSPQFKRQWHSGYQGIKAGRQDKHAVAKLLHEQLPATGLRVYALDTTIWPHPRARTLNGLVYEYNATLSKGQAVISKAHVYSGLCWVPQRKGSWALPLSMRRMPVTSTAVSMGVAQVKQFIRQRGAVSDDTIDIIASDGHYGTHLYLSAFKDEEQLGAITRLRCDRVLTGPPPAYSGRGRPSIHGKRFAFKEAETWWEPDKQDQFEDAYHGQVDLQAWRQLHTKQDATTPFTVIRAQIHQERTVKKWPRAIWLAYIGPELTICQVWECFDHRWAIEIVFTQMTKEGIFTIGVGRNHVADFDLVVVNDNTVNEQLNQLAALSKVKGVEGWLKSLAKVLNVLRQLEQVKLLLGLGFQLAQLMAQTGLRLNQFAALALKLVPADDLSQIDFQQSTLLTFQLGQGGLKTLPASLEGLRQPFANLGSFQLMDNECWLS